MPMLQQKVETDAGVVRLPVEKHRPALRAIASSHVGADRASSAPVSGQDAAPRRDSDDVHEDRWSLLMAAAQNGDAGCYRQLLIEIDPWLRRYYARRLPSAMVEDAAQETLLAVHKRRHTYEPGRPFKAWLAGISRYKWIDRLRSLSREPATLCADDEYEALAIDDHETAITSAIVLDDLLAQLKPAQSQVIRLVRLEGYSIEEASRRTGQSQSLVKVNIHRGIARLSALSDRQQP